MIDWDKPIQTESGRPARVICRDRLSRGGLHNVVLVKPDRNKETVAVADADGEGEYVFGVNAPVRFVNPPEAAPQPESWVSGLGPWAWRGLIYGDGSTLAFDESGRPRPLTEQLRLALERIDALEETLRHMRPK